jgi:hypothetical protein
VSTQPPPLWHQQPQQGAFGPPAPGPYGAAPWYGPPAPPPKPANGAKVAGIVLACVLGLVMVAGGLVLAFGTGGPTSEQASGHDGPTAYTLTLPRTLLGGAYTRGRDISDALAKTRPQGEYAATIDYKGAFYTASGGGQLLLSGMSSPTLDPSYPTYNILDGIEQSPTAEVEIPRRKFTPDAGGEPLQCEVLSKDQQGTHLVFPVCSWADGHTQAAVSRTHARSATTAPGDIDLAAFARQVADIRDEVRVPAGS